VGALPGSTLHLRGIAAWAAQRMPAAAGRAAAVLLAEGQPAGRPPWSCAWPLIRNSIVQGVVLKPISFATRSCNIKLGAEPRSLPADMLLVAGLWEIDALSTCRCPRPGLGL
jgi:hypothetical protein